MINVESFRIGSFIEIIQEWFQVKEVFMEHLNNFNSLAGIQILTSLLKSKDILLRVQHPKYVKCAFTVIFCVDFDIKMKSSCPKYSSLPDHVQKADHFIFFLTTTIVNNNSNIRNLIVIIVSCWANKWGNRQCCPCPSFLQNHSKYNQNIFYLKHHEYSNHIYWPATGNS